MTVGIYSKVFKEKLKPALTALLKHLREKHVEVLVHEGLRNQAERAGIKMKNKTFSTHIDLKERCEYLFCIGGDGTILDAISLVRDSDIPMIGINTGRLGFLAGINPANIEKAVDAVVKGTYSLDTRTLLQVDANKPLFDEFNIGLNELTIQRRETSSLITIHVYLNGEKLNSYWADGIIVSSPTGSTGYSLSCGGPIIHPSSDNFVITPVSPHNLNLRPIVVSNEVTISMKVEGRSSEFICTLDSRVVKIDDEYQVAVKKAPYPIKLLRLDEVNFINALKDKLLWGYDTRN